MAEQICALEGTEHPPHSLAGTRTACVGWPFFASVGITSENGFSISRADPIEYLTVCGNSQCRVRSFIGDKCPACYQKGTTR